MIVAYLDVDFNGIYKMHKEQVRFLYKTILRLHRALPKELRELGDQYVKDEFKRHKGISPEHVAPFMMEWANYCATLAKQVGLKGPKTGQPLGQHLDEAKLDNFENQQLYQLYELKKSIDGGEDVNSTAKSK